jgi:hypothetical protein
VIRKKPVFLPIDEVKGKRTEEDEDHYHQLGQRPCLEVIHHAETAQVQMKVHHFMSYDVLIKGSERGEQLGMKRSVEKLNDREEEVKNVEYQEQRHRPQVLYSPTFNELFAEKARMDDYLHQRSEKCGVSKGDSN